jgi:integrase
MTSAKTFFRFAAENHKITTGNPAATVTYRAKKTDMGHGLSYSDDEAKRIVTAALNKPDHIKLPVLIAAHTGARLSEFIDAHTADIEMVEGVWCLQIREDNRQKG